MDGPGKRDQLKLYMAMNESDEAQYVAAQILAGISHGRQWQDHAVLYRMNAQSNAMEYAFKRNGIPYRIIGGTRFFDRAEVKDMLAYLCVVNNPADDLRLRRIINRPARGIGTRTIDQASAIAAAEGVALYEVVRRAKLYPELQRSSGKLEKFVTLIETLRSQVEVLELADFYEEVMSASGYIAALEAKTRWKTAPGLRMLRSCVRRFRATWRGRRSPASTASWTKWPCIRTWTARKAARTA